MKRYSTTIICIVSLFLAAACSRETQPDPGVPQDSPSKGVSSALVPGSMIIEVSDELAAELDSGTLQTRSGELNSVLGIIGAVSAERLYPDAGEWEPRHREAGLHRWFRIKYDPEALPATKAAGKLSDIPGVLHAGPQRRIRSTAYFNDPMSGSQWSISESAYGINVQPVWDTYTAGRPEVIVAVIDGGVQLDHPDLAASCIPAGSDGSRSFISGHSGYRIPADDHGTHVAGIIGAVSNNNLGVSGIAGGYDGKGGIRILSCPILMADPNDPEKTIGGDENAALVWAADHGAVIANNSWGYVYDTEEEAMAGDADLFAPAVNYFVKYAGCDKNGKQRADSPMRGGLVVFAAGNESFKMGWPAALEQVVAVGSTGQDGKRAYYTNYGNWVDICAPGGDMKSGQGILSTISNNSYKSLQGTSMACPHVSGVAALLVSHYGGPGFTCERLRERLIKGASAKKAPGQIGPMLDAMGAFTLGSKLPPKAPDAIDVKVSANTITLSWKVTEDPDDIKAFGYVMAFTEGNAPIESLYDLNGIPTGQGTVKVMTGKAQLGDTVSGTITGLKFTTGYNAAVFAFDYQGNYSLMSEVMHITTGENNPPVITRTDDRGNTLKAFQKLYCTFKVDDPDGHKVSMSFDGGSEAFRAEYASGTANVTITGIKAPAGKYKATLTATDEFGLSASCDLEYEILENHIPVMLKNIDDIILGSKGESVTLKISDYIYDEDEEPLYFKVTYSEDGVAKAAVGSETIKISAEDYGLTKVDIEASDISGTKCKLDFSVLVRSSVRPVDIYPNPVKTTLFIRPGTGGTLETTIRNKAGATVYSSGGEVSPFEPLKIDMSGQAAGTYTVTLKGCGADGVYSLVKI